MAIVENSVETPLKIYEYNYHMGACYIASVISNSLQPYGLQPARFLCLWGFSNRDYWSGLPCPPLGDLLDSGLEPVFHVSCNGRWVLYHQCHLESPKLSYDPSVPLLGIYPKKITILKDICTPLFIAALFTIART